MQRYVRSWVNSGSRSRSLEMTRMTHHVSLPPSVTALRKVHSITSSVMASSRNAPAAFARGITGESLPRTPVSRMSPYESRPCRVEQVHGTPDIELVEASKPGAADQRLGTGRAEAGTKPRAAIGERLRHAMEKTEAVKHGGDRIDVVLEPVGSLGLHNKHRAVLFQQCADLLQRPLRRREIVDAIACRDEVKGIARVEIIGSRCQEGDPL